MSTQANFNVGVPTNPPREAGFSIKSRSYFSRIHFKNLEIFVKRAQEIENNAPMGHMESIEEIRSFSMAAVISAACFLEARVNEIFVDVDKGFHSKEMVSLSEDERSLIKEVLSASSKIGQLDVVEKSSLLLALLRKESLDLSAGKRQNIRQLIRLRNELAHSRPESLEVDATKGDDKQKYDDLRNLFEVNRLVGAGSVFFPTKCFGAGCAQWALDVAKDFSDEFNKKTGFDCT